MSIIISVANQKGGVGKTTTSVNLAHALTLRPCNKKVLVIDMDPQSNASSILGTVPPEEQTRTVSQLFDDELMYSSSCITKSKYKNLDLIPSCLDLFISGSSLSHGNPMSFMCLAKKIDKATLDTYDFIIIDCRPDIGGVFLNNALSCSDYFIVPVEGGSVFSIAGIQQFIAAVSQISAFTLRQLRMLGILITMCEKRTLSYNSMMTVLENKFGANIFSTKIPRAADVGKSHLVHETVVGHYPRSASTRAYKNLAIEVLQRCDLIDQDIKEYIKAQGESVLENTENESKD